MRLVEQTTVANWLVGRVEVFVDGSWGQVCGTETFTTSDAAVVCRQLGYGAGALWPTRIAGRPRRPAPKQPVADEVVLAGSPGCNGTERTLLQCSTEGKRGTPFSSVSGCADFSEYADQVGVNTDVVVACVTADEPGVLQTPRQSRVEASSCDRQVRV